MESSAVTTKSYDDEESYAKLKKINEIRQKTLKLQSLHNSIHNLVTEMKEEEERVEEYKKEHNLLLIEKMAHVETLRLIHTDINTMESLLKQSSVDRTSMLQQIQDLLQLSTPLKSGINVMREEIGLQKLDEHKWDVKAAAGVKLEKTGTDEVFHHQHQPLTLPTNNIRGQLHPFFTPPAPPQSFSSSGSSNVVGDHNKLTSQPPPMKSCSSCHQLIHRNAPICPLCKAKSKSRNPKKPRKYQKMSEELQ